MVKPFIPCSIWDFRYFSLSKKMLIGTTLLRRYKICDELGEGGFGKTYLANDLALPGNPYCVVKHLSPKVPNPKVFPIAKRLFDEEAEILAILGQHERIPTLYAHFSENNQFYLVQEFIEGHDLCEEIKPGSQLREEEVIDILQQILEVLAFVHQNSVIHRDIKPSNIMRRKQDGKLVLIDFGAVKRPSILSMDSTGQTTFTIAIGSPGYMACEHSQGKPKLASDIYAVGIMVIQALTGLRPEQLPEDENTGEIIWRDFASVSDKLGDFIDKMVRYHFKQRYQDASEALQELNTTFNLSETTSNPVVIINTSSSSANQTSTPSSPKNIEQKTTVVSRSKISKSVKLTLAVGTGLLGCAIISFALMWRTVNPSFSANLDFSKLERKLKGKKWQEADKETDRIMLKMAGGKPFLDKESIEQLDCTVLQKIDALWLENSNGRFGFSVQKEIYEETGNIIGTYSQVNYFEFANLVKWRAFGGWKSYSQLTWKEKAPAGHLPTPGTRANNKEALRFGEGWMVLDRVADCGL